MLTACNPVRGSIFRQEKTPGASLSSAWHLPDEHFGVTFSLRSSAPRDRFEVAAAAASAVAFSFFCAENSAARQIWEIDYE